MKILAVAAVAIVAMATSAGSFASNPPTVLLHTADPFAVIGGSAITDVPTSTITGNVGLSPAAGSFFAGLTCAEVTGSIYAVDATGLPCFLVNAPLLTTAKGDVNAAYLDAFGRLPDTTYAVADNQLGLASPLVPGVYRFGHAATANLIGNLTLNGDADAVWIFQATSDFVTATSSTVTLTGGAQACNVFWQVGSFTTLGGSSTLRGTVLSSTYITVGSGATVEGRLLAGAQASDQVTLINDTIKRPSSCVTQASVNAALAAAAAAQAAAAAAVQAAANAQAAADAAAAAAKAADVQAAAVAAAQAAAAAATAAQAAATAQAAIDKAAAVEAKAAVVKAAAVKAAQAAIVARAAAQRAATAKRVALARRVAIAKRIAAIRTARSHAGFTG